VDQQSDGDKYTDPGRRGSLMKCACVLDPMPFDKCGPGELSRAAADTSAASSENDAPLRPLTGNCMLKGKSEASSVEERRLFISNDLGDYRRLGDVNSGGCMAFDEKYHVALVRLNDDSLPNPDDPWQTDTDSIFQGYNYTKTFGEIDQADAEDRIEQIDVVGTYIAEDREGPFAPYGITTATFNEALANDEDCVDEDGDVPDPSREGCPPHMFQTSEYGVLLRREPGASDDAVDGPFPSDGGPFPNGGNWAATNGSGKRFKGDVETDQWEVIAATEAAHSPGVINRDNFDFLHQLLGFPAAAPLTGQSPLIIRWYFNDGDVEKGILVEHAGTTGPSIRLDHIYLKRANSSSTTWEQGNDLGHISGTLAPAQETGDTQDHPVMCPGDKVVFVKQGSDLESNFNDEAYANDVTDDFLDGLEQDEILGLFHRQGTKESNLGAATYLHLVDLIGTHDRSSGAFGSPRKDGSELFEGSTVAVQRTENVDGNSASSPSYDASEWMRIVDPPSELPSTDDVTDQFRCPNTAKLFFELIRFPGDSGDTVGPLFVIRNEGDSSVSTADIQLAVSSGGRYKYEAHAPLTSESTFSDSEIGAADIPSGGAVIVGGVDKGAISVGDRKVNVSAFIDDPLLQISSHNTLFGNADDVWSLFESGIEVDTYGQLGVVPENGWEVAGTGVQPGVGYTLIRANVDQGTLNWNDKGSTSDNWNTPQEQDAADFLSTFAEKYGLTVEDVSDVAEDDSGVSTIAGNARLLLFGIAIIVAVA